MKIVGFLVCGPNEADRYLERTLKEFERLCDEVMVVCNNTDKKTEKMITDYGFDWYRDDREWGRYQPTIKEDLLKKIGATYNPDVILPLDADEIYGEKFDRIEVESLFQGNSLGYYFYIVNHWNNEQRYRKAISFWNVRAYRYEPRWGLHFLKRNVHCGLAPPWAYQYGRHAGHIVRHFGLMLPEDRQKKVDRYEKYDPKADKVGIGGWYQALASKTEGSEFIEKELYAKVQEEVQRMNQKDKKFNMSEPKKWVYVRHPKSGREFEIDEKLLSHYTSQGCTVVGQIETPTANAFEAPVVEEPVMEMCDDCGKEFKSKAGLKRHIKVHEKDNS